MKKSMLHNSILAIVSLVILYYIFYRWLDIPIAQWLRQHLNDSTLVKLSLGIKIVFSPQVWLVIALASLIIGCWMHYGQKRTTMAQPWLFFSMAYFLAFILGFIFKFILARYRPELLFQSNVYGFDFFKLKDAFNSTPSGHALANFAALYAIAKILNKRAVTILLMLLATVICFSRVIILDHYVSDVIFGAYVGILSVYWMSAFFTLKKINPSV